MPIEKAETLGVYHAIYRRRMAWAFKPAAVPRSAIERMLDAAVWAPNHRLTEPWRFFVLEKDSPARREAGDLAYDWVLQRTDDPRRAGASKEMVLDPPYVLYAYSVPGADEEITRENYAAVCCAIQNIALAGVAEGLAVTWETGGITRHPELKGLLGAETEWDLVVMLLIGFPGESPSSRRTPVSRFVRWHGSE